MRALTQKQHGEYFEQGFTIIEKLLDDSELERLRERLRLAALGKLDAGIKIGMERGLTAEPAPSEDALVRVRKVSNLARHDPYFRELVSQDRLVGVARDLLGDEIRYIGDEAQLKPAKQGSAHPWHQDEPYFKEMAVPIVTLWLAVDQATEANGCMQVVPGSHLKGIVARGDEKRFWLTDDEVDTHSAVSATLEPGSVLVFHSRLLHGSGPNTTEQPRRSMICRYADVSALTDRQRSIFDQYGVVLDDASVPTIFHPVV